MFSNYLEGVFPQHDNGLTAADEEMFQILEEECAELIQAISKIRRHGVHGKYQDGSNNLEHLFEEIGDVHACIEVLARNGLINPRIIEQMARGKLDRLKVPGNNRVHFITPEMIP